MRQRSRPCRPDVTASTLSSPSLADHPGGRPQRRWKGLVGAIALHVALLFSLLNYRPAAPPDQPDLRPSITWLAWRPSALPPARLAVPAPLPLPLMRPLPPMQPAPARPVPPATPATASAPPAAAPAAPAAAPTRRADDILQQARRDVGAIDRDLRADGLKRKLITAPADTAATRLAKGFDDAAAAAPNRWFEAPKVEALLDPGGYGRRMYRVTGAAGTYCITVESNHAPDGLDSMKNGIHQKVTDCGGNPPPPATTQAY